MRSVMHSGHYTVSTESHCDRALIVKAHSQQCAMEGTTVILDVTDSNGLTLTLRETAKITPWTSLYTTQPPCLLQKKKTPNVHFTTSCHSFSQHTHPPRNKPNSKASSSSVHSVKKYPQFSLGFKKVQ